jgi:hypothetical protein
MLSLCFQWGINYGLLVNVKEKKIALHDGGHTEYSATALSSVTKGVVGVLKHLDATANRAVYVSSAVITQQKLFELAKQVLGEHGWIVTEPSTVEALKSSFEALKTNPDNVLGWVIPQLTRSIFCREHQGKHVKDDNELLGVPQSTDEDIKRYMKEASQV